jgi:hypothetical protein
MTRRTLVLLSASLLLSGCAGESAMRTAASTSASILDEYRKGLENYVNAENQALNATDARINDLAVDERKMAGTVGARLTGWKAVKNESALNMFDALTEVTPEVVLASSPDLRMLQPPSAPISVTVDTKQFSAVVKSLSALGKAPDLSDRVSFLQKYGATVADAYKSSLDDAAAKASGNAVAAQQQKARTSP